MLLSWKKNTEEEIIQFVDNYLTCSTDDGEIGELVELQSHKHSKSCRKKGKAICRFGFPLPPLPRTMLLHPLDEDIEKYKTKHSELQKSMTEYKTVTDIAFDEFLKQVPRWILITISSVSEVISVLQKFSPSGIQMK